MKKYNDVYAELEYFNNQNTLVYYRNNLTRNNFRRINDELYILHDKQSFRGLNKDIKIQVHSNRIKDIFDDKLPEGIYIKGGLNGFGLIYVIAEKRVFPQLNPYERWTLLSLKQYSRIGYVFRMKICSN